MDDERDGSLITYFRRWLEGELRAQTGLGELRIFQDRDDIRWGEARVAFLIPVVTPTYLTSENCRQELARFLDRERDLGRDNLIFPVYWITVPALESHRQTGPVAPDDVAAVLAGRQYADWRELRHRVQADPDPPADPALREAMAALAERVRAAIEMPARNAPSAQNIPSVWNIPPRNHFFTGRATIIEELHRRLAGF